MGLDPDSLLTTTRAVRRRLDFERAVPRALVEECLEIALQAPNGSNMNSWRWLAIDDRARIARAAEIYRDAMRDQIAHPSLPYRQDPASMPRHPQLMASARHLAENLHRSPVLVVPLLEGRLEGADLFVSASMWASIIPAIWSFMLALRARGLGSCWTTVHLLREREMAELLGIDASQYTQAGLFPVAWTLGSEFRRAWRRPLREVLSWNGVEAR
ncbi:MAG TPA: nitroreductase family protein [Myxococcota bacterium]|nr:nitroreductase family protein [Myxococcota bacterium]